MCQSVPWLLARTTDPQRGNSLHCTAENSLPLPNFYVRPKHILSATSAQNFSFLWFMPSLGVRSPWMCISSHCQKVFLWPVMENSILKFNKLTSFFVLCLWQWSEDFYITYLFFNWPKPRKHHFFSQFWAVEKKFKFESGQFSLALFGFTLCFLM